MEEIKKEVEEEKIKTEEKKEIKPKVKKTSVEKCEVLWVRNNKVSFSFAGYALSFITDKDLTKIRKNGFVDVEYKGKFNTKLFEIIGIK